MRSVWFALILFIYGLSARAEGLSKESIELLDAAMFVFTGIEDNTKDNTTLPPWRREVREGSIEFWRMGENGIGSSDDDVNKIIRRSAYVRHVVKISSPEPCVFRFEERTDFSNGNSQEDFSAYSLINSLNSHTFNLADAYTFKLEYDRIAKPYLLIQGPRAVCETWGSCENGWNSWYGSGPIL